jgi:hypothetical protein
VSRACWLTIQHPGHGNASKKRATNVRQLRPLLSSGFLASLAESHMVDTVQTMTRLGRKSRADSLSVRKGQLAHTRREPHLPRRTSSPAISSPVSISRVPKIGS